MRAPSVLSLNPAMTNVSEINGRESAHAYWLGCRSQCYYCIYASYFLVIPSANSRESWWVVSGRYNSCVAISVGRRMKIKGGGSFSFPASSLRTKTIVHRTPLKLTVLHHASSPPRTSQIYSN